MLHWVPHQMNTSTHDKYYHQKLLKQKYSICSCRNVERDTINTKINWLIPYLDSFTMNCLATQYTQWQNWFLEGPLQLHKQGLSQFKGIAGGHGSQSMLCFVMCLFTTSKKYGHRRHDTWRVLCWKGQGRHWQWLFSSRSACMCVSLVCESKVQCYKVLYGVPKAWYVWISPKTLCLPLLASFADSKLLDFCPASSSLVPRPHPQGGKWLWAKSLV